LLQSEDDRDATALGVGHNLLGHPVPAIGQDQVGPEAFQQAIVKGQEAGTLFPCCSLELAGHGTIVDLDGDPALVQVDQGYRHRTGRRLAPFERNLLSVQELSE
jgi:hypothetical protein